MSWVDNVVRQLVLLFSFGVLHCGGYPGFWQSDAYGLTGGIESIAPMWGVEAFDPYNPAGVVTHHIASGLVGMVAGIFHLCVRPSLGLYSILRMGNIESVLASSIAVVSWASL